MSASKAWKKLGCKHSPMKAVKYSPIRPACHLLPFKGIYADSMFRAHVWTLLNTEEFHYQSSGSLVHEHSKDPVNMAQALSDHINVVDWSERLIDFEFVARGSFGRVYRVTDSLTKEHYAVKVINPPNVDQLNSLTFFLTSLIRERNSFTELNKSIFFVRLLAAIQSSKRFEILFVLDYCICDLVDLISIYPDYNELETLKKNYFDGVSFKLVSESMTKFLSMDYQTLFFIYLFEMACGLHYLASRHIVHADIKSENMLIARNGHLKFSDFGLSFKTDYFYRNSTALIPSSDFELNAEVQLNLEIKSRGTPSYFDPEIHVARMLKSQKNMIPILKKKLQKSLYFRKLTRFDQNFLADLYAVGLVAMELLTGGLVMTDDDILPSAGTAFWKVESVYDDKLNSRVFSEPLGRMSDCVFMQTVFKFIRTIFLPRAIRAEGYLAELTMFHQRELVKEMYLDISAIENLSFYKRTSTTKENVSNYIFPASYLENLEISLEANNDEENETCQEKENFNLHSLLYSSVRNKNTK